MTTGYRILGSIAAGGMGTVSLALRTDQAGEATPIAVKRLHANRAEDPESVAMFVDEACIASRIVHPNVLRIRDVEMLGEELVIVMDYVEGVSLGQLLRHVREAGETLPLPFARRILHDALQGLHAAHELADDTGRPVGIVHRDVSPHNLLVGTEGLTRVTDFGIALASGRLASTQSEVHVKGKLRYLSPEQIFRRGVDRRVDVFAAGIVLWETLTGRRLFDAGTEGETLAMILREPIAPPSTHRLDIPLELDEICLRALERDPTRRFSTAREFAEAIEASGELASRKEIGALVERCEGASFQERRAMLAAAARADSNPPGGDSRSGFVADRTAPSSPPRKRGWRGALAITALVVGGLAGACGAKLSAPAKAPDLSVTARGAREEAPVPLEPVVAPSVAVDLDSVEPKQSALADRRDVATEPTVLRAPRASGKPSRSKQPAPPSTKKAATAPSRPFMPSDL